MVADQRVVSGGGMFAGGAPLWAVYGINYGLGRAYDATLGPWIRQTTQKKLKQKKTAPYIPPNTPGFLARDLAYQGLSFLTVDKSFQWLTAPKGAAAAAAKAAAGGAAAASAAAKAAGPSTAIRQLVGSNGFTALNAAVGSSISPAAAASAFTSLVGRTFVIAGLVSALDAAYAASVGPKIEQTVNLPFGIKKTADAKEIRGGVPLNTVKQTAEQATRQFGRTFTSTVTYTVIWKELGSLIAKNLALRIGGPAGGVVGAIAGTVATSAINHAVIQAIGTKASDGFQNALRGVKKVLGKKLDEEPPKDVMATMGDRLSSSVKSVLIPMTTAFGSGHRQVFVDSVTPRP